MKEEYQVKDLQVLSPFDAISKGYESITITYKINSQYKRVRDKETAMWLRQCEQVKGCNCIAVEFSDGVEMWRHTSEMNIDPRTGRKITKYLETTYSK